MQPIVQITHFGDFDPVGLQEFARLLAKMPTRVSLFIPEGIEALFHRFSNRALLDANNNRAILAGLERGLHPSLDRILELIALHGPLEQEAMLILPSEFSA